MNTTSFKKVAACIMAAVVSMSAYAAAGVGASSAEDSSIIESAEVKNKNAEIVGTQDRLDELTQKQAELDEKINSTNGDINAEQENQAAIEEQILTVQDTIDTLDTAIRQAEDEIYELEESIQRKEMQISEKKKQIDKGVVEFNQRLRSMYIAGSDSYSEIIIGATDFYDMLMKIELVKRVAEHDDTLIDNLIALKNQYEADEAELTEAKNELEERRSALLDKEEAHKLQKEKLDKLFEKSKENLDKLYDNKDMYEQNMAQIEREQEEFEDQLAQLYIERQKILDEEEQKRKEEEERKRKEEEERKRKEEEERKRKEEEEKKRKAEEEKKRKEEEERKRKEAEEAEDDEDEEDTEDEDYEDEEDTDEEDEIFIPASTDNSDYGYEEKSRFTWPVPGHYNITYGFGWRNSGTLVGNHGGIDIYDSGIKGAEIIAADEGTVILAENYCPHDFGKNYSCGCGGGYGRYCIIEHSDGYWTVYGHASNIIVHTGDHVEKGDVLGYVGSTGHSTGPHTHFEVRQNNVRLDPQEFV